MDVTIKKELAALREEIEALRAQTEATRSAEAPAPAGEGQEGHDPKAWTEQLSDLITTMHGAFEGAERSVVVHPVAGVAAAFVAGLLIGRLTKVG
jgi:septal ring factor EnvC (AmiA/AmiB activator)